MIKRYNATKDLGDGTLIELIIDLTRLKKQVAGWQAVGAPAPTERVWHYRAFDPLTDKDKLHPREDKRLRNVELPPGLANWQDPGFDVSQWQSGRAPVGVGDYKAWKYGLIWTATPDRTIANNSAWGTGEFLLMRTNFEVKDLDHDCYRISILANQGYHIYLNGQKIHTFAYFAFYPKYDRIMLDKQRRQASEEGFKHSGGLQLRALRTGSEGRPTVSSHRADGPLCRRAQDGGNRAGPIVQVCAIKPTSFPPLSDEIQLSVGFRFQPLMSTNHEKQIPSNEMHEKENKDCSNQPTRHHPTTDHISRQSG